MTFLCGKNSILLFAPILLTPNNDKSLSNHGVQFEVAFKLFKMINWLKRPTQHLFEKWFIEIKEF